MTLRLTLAVLHLLGLGIGLGAVWARARGLRGALYADGLRRVFYADNAWGLAALLWIGTGLARLFLQTEKSTAFYIGNHLFWTKMALLALIIALEILPMLTLIRWRRQSAKGEAVDTSPAARLATISVVQAVLTMAMVVCATAMARGLGTVGH